MIPENHPIAKAVEPLRKASTAAAVKHAKQFLSDLKKRVEEQPDRTVLAPYPKSTLSRSEYRKALQFYQTVSSLTKLDESKPRAYNHDFHRDPCYVVWDKKAAEKFVKNAVDDAERTYIAYVLKLIGKVESGGNKTKDAKVVSEMGVWSYSILRVELESGEVQHWKTQMICNVSVLGKLFNQFPTRRMKGSK
jgi:hypothetical protein